MSRGHMSFILANASRNEITKQAFFWIFGKNSWNFDNFLFDLDDHIGIMSFGLNMLGKSLSGRKLFPKLTQLYLH